MIVVRAVFALTGAIVFLAALGSAPLAAELPAHCVPAETGRLQDVTGTPAAPYFVHHPTPNNRTGATVVFLPGGSGNRTIARRLWDTVLSRGAGADGVRVVVPYAIDVDFLDESARTLQILDEVLACYGGNPAKVHLAGTSNGGLAAFALMLARPERFATLLGAPGAFPKPEPTRWSRALAGRAVFNGVGANDTGWRSDVKATHETLAAAGVESVYVEFPGAGHRLGPPVDASLFFDFWSRH